MREAAQTHTHSDSNSSAVSLNVLSASIVMLCSLIIIIAAKQFRYIFQFSDHKLISLS